MKKIIITGNVGKDPEVRSDSAGNSFVVFTVAVSVGTKTNPKTDWIDITCNGKTADIVKMYVKKGIKVLVEGFPSVNAYISRENKAVGTLRIAAHNVELLSKKDDTVTHDEFEPHEPDYSNVAGQSNKEINAIKPDDIPF